MIRRTIADAQGPAAVFPPGLSPVVFPALFPVLLPGRSLASHPLRSASAGIQLVVPVSSTPAPPAASV